MSLMAVDAAELLDFATSLPEGGERDYKDDATIFTSAAAASATSPATAATCS